MYFDYKDRGAQPAFEQHLAPLILISIHAGVKISSTSSICSALSPRSRCGPHTRLDFDVWVPWLLYCGVSGRSCAGLLHDSRRPS